jgi:hypothetical protein
MPFINTQYFREAATYFNKNGRYNDGEFESPEWEMYWDEEHRRVNNGYTVGGAKITGMHYLYLNYLPILLNKIKEGEEDKFVVKDRKVATRGEAFASFWDEDFILFWTWEIAKNGINQKDLDMVCSYQDIPIIKTPENLAGGKNHLWLKPRGVGASWKAAVIPNYNQFFKSNSRTFLVAHEEKYLVEDGLFDKYKFQRNFMNTNASGFRRAFSIMANKDMHYRASSWEQDQFGERIEKGKKSDVYGVTINNKPDNIRGKRGDILYEEFGSFPGASKTWEVAQQSVEQDGVVFGTQTGFGTGGDEGDGIMGLEMMFRDPKTYNLLEFTDTYGDIYKDEPSGYFTPAYKSLSFIDKDGNTNIKEAKEFFDARRQIKENANDPKALEGYKSEKPYNGEEALSSGTGNIFPTDLLKLRIKTLLKTKEHLTHVNYGTFDTTNDGHVYHKVSKLNERTYEKYPVNPKDANTKIVAILHNPYSTGKTASNRPIVPPNMYRICVDTYRFDATTGDSIGSFFVIENPNNITAYKGDRIVAWYHGRPETLDDFNEIIFAAAQYYNAKVAIENDEPGDIISYAKRHKHLLKYLEEEFELGFSVQLKTSSLSKRKFGMAMSSGKDNLRISYGNSYINEWLKRKRFVDLETGKEYINIDYIYSIGLLEELARYKDKLNTDRVSALRVGVYHEKEIAYKNKRIDSAPKRIYNDSFFNS